MRVFEPDVCALHVCLYTPIGSKRQEQSTGLLLAAWATLPRPRPLQVGAPAPVLAPLPCRTPHPGAADMHRQPGARKVSGLLTVLRRVAGKEVGVPKTGAGGPPLASPPHVSTVPTLTQKENEFSAPKQICLDFSGLHVPRFPQLFGGSYGDSQTKAECCTVPADSQPRLWRLRPLQHGKQQ